MAAASGGEQEVDGLGEPKDPDIQRVPSGLVNLSESWRRLN
jgi:hypothetical protein